jgi:hypothetical protein
VLSFWEAYHEFVSERDHRDFLAEIMRLLGHAYCVCSGSCTLIAHMDASQVFARDLRTQGGPTDTVGSIMASLRTFVGFRLP